MADDEREIVVRKFWQQMAGVIPSHEVDRLKRMTKLAILLHSKDKANGSKIIHHMSKIYTSCPLRERQNALQLLAKEWAVDDHEVESLLNQYTIGRSPLESFEQRAKLRAEMFPKYSYIQCSRYL
eukprot:TRINITY_DN5568_c0_g1_i2.p1 TRINITY_DN5568_c0_g1~~TRINITY_DN5568_c0_g1_i2.p1  ORF type:complete len:141 (+),score=36.94 TRINITY_DN5568_c0_g1_i2:49-423(+)